MKGFSPRERFGLIMLATVVAGCFLLGMISWEGCERSEPVENINSVDNVATDSVVAGKESMKRAGTYRDSLRNKRKQRGKKRNKKKKESKEKSPAERRSLRDERL